MKINFIILLFILSICSLPGAEIILSDTLRYKTPKTRRYELDEMRVIAKSPSESAGKIDIQYLENVKKTEELTLSGLLKNIHGLSITTGSKGESSLKIRGFRKENIKIMIDGRQINGGYFGNVNLSEIPVFDISEIHVIKGAVSPLYGANSSGGVVNFVTKKPDNQSWLTIRSSVKRNNTQNLQLITAHRFDLWDYWLNISGYKTDGFVLAKSFKPTSFEDGNVRNFSENKSIDIQTKMNFTLFDFHSIGFSFGYTFADERNVPSSVFEQRFRKFTDWQRYQFTVLSDFQVSPWLKIQPNIYYDAYDNTYQEFSDINLSNMTYDSRLESWTFGSQVKSEYIFSDKNKLFHLAKYERQTYNRKDNNFYKNWTTNTTHLQNTSLSFNHKFNTLWQTGMSLGISQSSRSFKETTEDLTMSLIKTEWYGESSFSILYDDLINNFSLAVSRNIQYPTMHHLYSNTRGNARLMPEKVHKSELNLGKKILAKNHIVSIENSLFFNKIEAMIDRVNSPVYINQKNLINAGNEFSIAYQFYERFETEIQVAYINLKMNKNYDFYEIPEWSLNNTIYWNILNNLKYSYNISWSDKLYSPDQFGRLQILSEKTIHNTSLSYGFKRYNFALAVTNIFDHNYQEEYGYPAPGRNFSLSFECVVF